MKHCSIVFALALLGLAGCEADKQGINEKAAIEGKAASDANIQSENANLALKSKAMEDDLATRHRFYRALRGRFEGDLQTEQGTYRIRITLVPTLHAYKTGRSRQLDEITSDLNNLYFNAQVVQWNAANPLSAVGCRVSGVRPDLVNGEITIASESCANLYSLRITDSMLPPSELSTARIIDIASRLASQVTEGRVDKINAISGEVHPSTNASIYRFVVTRDRTN